MPAMRRWRDYRTKIVHAFTPLQNTYMPGERGKVVTLCGVPIELRRHHNNMARTYTAYHVPSGKRLTDELPSVKTQVTCLGCLAA